MKSVPAISLILIIIFSLLLLGCKDSASAYSSTFKEDAPSLSTDDTIELYPPPTAGDLPFQQPNSGAVKIQYTENISTVRYITSASQLPDHEVFQQYDESFFLEKALIIVYESVSSGSVQVGIQNIEFENSTASVTLFHHAPPGDGTAVMATWMLWAEVETGLDYEWVITNPALKSNHEVK